MKVRVYEYGYRMLDFVTKIKKHKMTLYTRTRGLPLAVFGIVTSTHDPSHITQSYFWENYVTVTQSESAFPYLGTGTEEESPNIATVFNFILNVATMFKFGDNPKDFNLNHRNSASMTKEDMFKWLGFIPCEEKPLWKNQ